MLRLGLESELGLEGDGKKQYLYSVCNKHISFLLGILSIPIQKISKSTFQKKMNSMFLLS